MGPLLLLSAIVVTGVLYVLVPTVADAARRFRGPRVVRCPSTHGPVNVELDTMHAAVTSLIGEPRLRIARCARWPECAHCDQGCLEGVDAAWAGQHGVLTTASPSQS
jgi:hypothetical protein